MGEVYEVARDIESIRLPQWGRVVATDDGVAPFVVVDPDGQPVEPISRFLRDFLARGRALGSVRSYAFDLHRWWRFLAAVGVSWDQATSAEVRDFVLWLCQADKQRRHRRTKSRATAGQINPVTRKLHQDDRYQPRTIRHSNAVLRSFYEFAIDEQCGPLVNPVKQERSCGRRANAHHNPLESFRAEGRLRYNPKLPRQRPRAMPDERWLELFGQMRSNRDRAILALAVSSGARAGELLGMRAADIDWGEQLIQVRRKGSRAAQWLPASAEAFVWLRLYVDEIDEPNSTQRFRVADAASPQLPGREIEQATDELRGAASGATTRQRRIGHQLVYARLSPHCSDQNDPVAQTVGARRAGDPGACPPDHDADLPCRR